MSFSEAIRTLQSLSVGKDYAAYELTLLSRLAASVNINSLRGRTFLPHEAGKPTKKELVLVFAEGEQAEEARRNGADVVGGSELIDEVRDCRPGLTRHESADMHRLARSYNHAYRRRRLFVHQTNCPL
jgi:large subunit ribosomal protein L1